MTSEPKITTGIWKSTNEKVAFGLFCALSENGRAKVSLDDAEKRLTLSRKELRDGFEILAQRRLLDVSLMLHRSGNMLSAEMPNPEVFDNPVSPEDYFFACAALTAAQKPGLEVV